MKARLEINGDGIIVTAETNKERGRLIDLWIGKARAMSMDGLGDHILIAPKGKRERITTLFFDKDWELDEEMR